MMIDFLKSAWHFYLIKKVRKNNYFLGIQSLSSDKTLNDLYRASISSSMELTYYSSESDLIYLKSNNVNVVTDRSYYILLEIFCQKIYALPPFILNQKHYVFDIGMNRGYASLYFANNRNCSKVFGFELDPDTFRFALKNINLNPNLSTKIEPFNFGLSNCEGDVEFEYISGRDGLSSLDKNCIRKFNHNVNSDIIKKTAIVKKASVVFEDLFCKCEKNSLKILKIDCEGAEYDIFDDLNSIHLLEEFDVIIGECHNGFDSIRKKMDNFALINILSEGDGLFLFCCVNNRYKYAF